MKVKPIRPEEIKVEIPDIVITAVNQLIQEEWNGTKAVVYLKDIKSRICELDLTINLNDMPSNAYDFEDLFAEYGWEVVYESPTIHETWDEYFEFTKKK